MTPLSEGTCSSMQSSACTVGARAGDEGRSTSATIETRALSGQNSAQSEVAATELCCHSTAKDKACRPKCTDAFTRFMRQRPNSLLMHRFYQTPAVASVWIDALEHRA